MLFSRSCVKEIQDRHVFTFSGTKLKIITYKYLGIYIDDKLSFKLHIDSLTKKLKWKIRFFTATIWSLV